MMSMKGITSIIDEAPECPKCESNNVGLMGWYYSPTLSQRRRKYRCRRCGSRFTAKAWASGKFDKETIEFGVLLLEKGFSSAQAAREVNARYGLSVAPQVIERWGAVAGKRSNRWQPGRAGARFALAIREITSTKEIAKRAGLPHNTVITILYRISHPYYFRFAKGRPPPSKRLTMKLVESSSPVRSEA
jgi:hypothetical protein